MGVTGTMNRGGGKLLKRQEIVEIDGYFEPNGTAAPSVIKIPGATVTRTGTGAFTVTMDDSYYEIVSAAVALQLHTAQDRRVLLTDTIAAASSSKSTVKLLVTLSSDGVTAADIANAAGQAGSRIHVSINLARRST